MLLDAFDSNWIAPLGPDVDAFEAEFAARVDVAHAVALSSGTAALHLALLLVGVGAGDEVLVPSFTFVATANAVRLPGRHPGVRRLRRRHLDDGPGARGRGARPAGGRRPAAGRRGHRRPLRPVVRLRPDPGRVRPTRGARGRGRGRGAGRHLPGAADRWLRPDGRVLVQRQQDHHHQRRRHAGDRVGRGGRAGPLPGHPGPRAVPPLRAHHGRLQLPPVQPAGRPRAGPAGRPRQPDHPAPGRSTPATVPPWPTSPASTSSPSPPTASPTTG